MKRRRRRDILRVQLVRIFELLADAGVISQMYVMHNSEQYDFKNVITVSHSLCVYIPIVILLLYTEPVEG